MSLVEHIDSVLTEARQPEVVLRSWGPNGATTDEGFAWLEKTKKSGHLYRGMEDAEYKATVGRGKPVHSTKKYSFGVEGTSFSDDPGVAEGYPNFGRSDPRRTGKPNWLVEVKKTDDHYLDTDHYWKSHEPVDTVTRVWRMDPQGDDIVIVRVKG